MILLKLKTPIKNENWLKIKIYFSLLFPLAAPPPQKKHYTIPFWVATYRLGTFVVDVQNTSGMG